MPRLLLAALAAAAALALGACGGDDDAGGADARELLDAAYSTDVRTADVDLDASLELAGVPLPGPLTLTLRGPYESRGATRLPLLDWDLEASGVGERFTGGVVVAAANAFLRFQGETYEVGEDALREFQRESREGPQSFDELEVDPLDWVRDPEVDGEETIAGTATTRVTAGLDVRPMLEAFNRFGARDEAFSDEEIDQIAGAVREVRFTSYVADADRTLRGVDVRARFTVPEALRGDVGGVRGGTLSVRLRLSEIDEPVTIEPPDDARPLDELFERLGLGSGLLTPA